MSNEMRTGVVLDNGGGLVKTAKIALSASSSPHRKKARLIPSLDPSPLVTTNALAKCGKSAFPFPASAFGSSKRPAGLLVASEIAHAPDVSAMTFRRPVERGVICQWDLQRDIWSSIFSKDRGIALVDFAEARLLVTEPLAVPLRSRYAMDELVFEQFGFGEYAPVCPVRLAAAALSRRNALVLDSGFSFTHAVPVVHGVEVASCARRLAIGGKALTNHLKETVSFRSWNMMEETAVMNAVKERLCYVSMNYGDELRRARNGEIAKDYVLPDLSRGAVDKFGHVMMDAEERDGTEQVLVMNNERIAVPEILFNPSDIGLAQAGVAELIFQAVEACPVEVRAELYANVILTGGNCRFGNFRDRVVQELRPLVSTNYDVNVYMDNDPMLTTFRGGVRAFAEDDALPLQYVSKQEYEDGGSDALLRRLYGDELH